MNAISKYLCVSSLSAFCAACGSDAGIGGGSDEPGMTSFGIVAGDLNNDGFDDFSLSTTIVSGPPPHDGFLSVFLQDASNPGAFIRSARLDTEWDPGAIDIADFNGDTVPDLVVQKVTLSTNDSDSRFAVFYQDSAATGRFPVSQETALSLISHIEAIDVDGDRLTDIVTVGAETTIFVNTPGSPGVLAVNQTAPISGSIVRAGDLNGDGQVDLVIGVGNPGLLRILVQRNNQFELVNEIDVGDQLNPISLDDVNLDGRLDIVAGSFPSLGSRSSRASLVLQAQDPLPQGEFLPPVHYLTDFSIRGVGVADVNGDSLPDIVTAHNLSTIIDNDVTLESSVGVLIQTSGGSFESAVTYAVDGQASEVALGDFNGDGLTDVVTNSDGAVILFNDPATPGTFLLPVPIGR